MKCSKTATFRLFDSLILFTVFLFQCIILNYFIIHHFRESSFPFFWFLADFFVLIIFALVLFNSFEAAKKCGRGEKHDNSSLSSSPRGSPSCEEGNSLHRDPDITSHSSKRSQEKANYFPLSHFSWIFYSIILVAKIVILFKSEIPQHLSKDVFFGPQMLKLGLGMTAIIFSLLVEAHHDAQKDPIRNSYIKSLSYGTALEVLDSVSFLSLLITAETHLIYTFRIENFIIVISSINLMLPAVALYKLVASQYGRIYNVPIESFYKLAHLMLVNVPYLAVRLYLWQFFATDTSIFIIKNIYSIIAFVRGLYPDLKKLKAEFTNKPFTGLKWLRKQRSIDPKTNGTSSGQSVHLKMDHRPAFLHVEEVPQL